MKNFFDKQVEKFKKQSIVSKILDIIFVVLIILIIIPATRKEVMTYASKLRMYITSVNTSSDRIEVSNDNNLEFIDEKGEQYTFADFSGKPVFINYWATWCPPCRAEMPALEKLYKEYKGDINFLFISQESFSKTGKFIKDHDYELPVYRLVSAPQQPLDYEVLPTTMFIAEGKLIFNKDGAVNWNSDKIKQILNEHIEK
ncbi:MAG: TlpA family protein disulfide reductase [Bacteroidales bacterium]